MQEALKVLNCLQEQHSSYKLKQPSFLGAPITMCGMAV